MISPHIDALNRRLGERLGLVCGGSLPRFAWKYAPEQPRFVYDRDNRTLLKKTWADAPAPDGQTLGKVWLLAEWRACRVTDHHGFSDEIRTPLIKDADYAPYFETALAPGELPSAALNQNYIFALDRQLHDSAEHNPRSFTHYMAEEKYRADQVKAAAQAEWQETVQGQYDANVGAFGNCQPGTRHGYLSFQNNESKDHS